MTEKKPARFKLPSVSVFGLIDQMDFSREPQIPNESRSIIQRRLTELGKAFPNKNNPPKKP